MGEKKEKAQTVKNKNKKCCSKEMFEYFCFLLHQSSVYKETFRNTVLYVTNEQVSDLSNDFSKTALQKCVM